MHGSLPAHVAATIMHKWMIEVNESSEKNTCPVYTWKKPSHDPFIPFETNHNLFAIRSSPFLQYIHKHIPSLDNETN